MLVIHWKAGDDAGYSDLLPSRWFETEGHWPTLRHDVEGPRGGRYHVRLALTVEGNIADLDYGGEHAAFNESDFYPGVMRIVFSDSSRTAVEAVMWKGEGEKQFKEQDAEGRELNVPLEGLDVFDPLDADDGRTKTERLIALRQGQPAFRNALIDAYEGRCAITGCEVREVLEAAHISPYRGTHTNHVTNGLLLRADIHTLFDRGLIRVDRNYRVSASPEVAAAYDLPATLTLPVSPAHQPSPDAFDQKWR